MFKRSFESGDMVFTPKGLGKVVSVQDDVYDVLVKNYPVANYYSDKNFSIDKDYLFDCNDIPKMREFLQTSGVDQEVIDYNELRYIGGFETNNVASKYFEIKDVVAELFSLPYTSKNISEVSQSEEAVDLSDSPLMGHVGGSLKGEGTPGEGQTMLQSMLSDETKEGLATISYNSWSLLDVVAKDNLTTTLSDFDSIDELKDYFQQRGVDKDLLLGISDDELIRKHELLKRCITFTFGPQKKYQGPMIDNMMKWYAPLQGGSENIVFVTPDEIDNLLPENRGGVGLIEKFLDGDVGSAEEGQDRDLDKEITERASRKSVIEEDKDNDMGRYVGDGVSMWQVGTPGNNMIANDSMKKQIQNMAGLMTDFSTSSRNPMLDLVASDLVGTEEE